MALPDHAGKLEIDFDSAVPGVPSTGGDRLATAQWRALMSRLAALSGQGDSVTSSP
jgi:hypothetical protein